MRPPDHNFTRLLSDSAVPSIVPSQVLSPPRTVQQKLRQQRIDHLAGHVVQQAGPAEHFNVARQPLRGGIGHARSELDSIYFFPSLATANLRRKVRTCSWTITGTFCFTRLAPSNQP